MTLIAPNASGPLLEYRWRETISRFINELYRPRTKTVDAAYVAKLSDSFLKCDASSAAFSVTLPPATGNIGARMIVKRINSGANAVTVEADGTETIDGSATQSLATQWAVIRLHSDGANWLTF